LARSATAAVWIVRESVREGDWVVVKGEMAAPFTRAMIAGMIRPRRKGSFWS
jgi:hypothetical protein